MENTYALLHYVYLLMLVVVGVGGTDLFWRNIYPISSVSSLSPYVNSNLRAFVKHGRQWQQDATPCLCLFGTWHSSLISPLSLSPLCAVCIVLKFARQNMKQQHVTASPSLQHLALGVTVCCLGTFDAVLFLCTAGVTVKFIHVSCHLTCLPCHIYLPLVSTLFLWDFTRSTGLEVGV